MPPRDLSPALQLGRIVYSRDELLTLGVSSPTVSDVRQCPPVCLHLPNSSPTYRRRRGRRSGLHVRRRQMPASCSITTRERGGEIPTIIGNRCIMSTNAVDKDMMWRSRHRRDNVTELRQRLRKIRISRHAAPSSHQLVFGLLNVQSANKK